MKTLLPIVILLLVALGCGSLDKPKPTTVDNSPPIEITAVDLVGAYKENEAAANAKYEGKMLAISGKIERISKSLEKETVWLEGKDGASVACDFDNEQAVANLKKDQMVTLVGRSYGMIAGLFVGMKDCKIK